MKLLKPLGKGLTQVRLKLQGNCRFVTKMHDYSPTTNKSFIKNTQFNLYSESTSGAYTF